VRPVVLALLLCAACSQKKQEEKRDLPPPVAAGGRINIVLTEKGFEPTPIQVTKGQPITLLVTRKTDQTCATELTIPEYKIDQKLPLDQTVEISFTPQKSGDLEYGCAMDHMVKGILQVR
jgi:plastocyanin domain-containing protein